MGMHGEHASVILLDGLLENYLVSLGVSADLEHVVDVVDESLAAGRKSLKGGDGAEGEHECEVESEEGVEREEGEEVEEGLEANKDSDCHLPLMLAEDGRHIRKTLRVFIHPIIIHSLQPQKTIILVYLPSPALCLLRS